MFNFSYKTIDAPTIGYFKDKGSKFEAYAFPIEDMDEYKIRLQEIKALHPKATHHCYAYRLGTDKNFNYRVNDDGEPSGTAGRPILGQIDSFELSNILIIVVRYYGGTNLGIPGLINAYKSAAKEVLQLSKIVEKELKLKLKIQCSFENLTAVMQVLKKINAKIIEQKYDDAMILVVEINRADDGVLMDSLKYIGKIV